MGYQVYQVGKRFGGYGVPAVCEFPKCKKVIDRGVSYACGNEPFSEHGCDRYFCSKHKDYHYWDEENDQWCKHEEDCNCEMFEVCDRCFEAREPFPYKNETKQWSKHVLKDESWTEWRKSNPKEVKKLKALLSR